MATTDPSVVPCDPEHGQGLGCLNTPIVETRNGPVIGFMRQDPETDQISVGTFWGIPFAEPPVGHNRLRAPQRLARRWESPLLAKNHSKICYQGFLASRRRAKQEQDEDCLYLNVYVPIAALGEADMLPVMVWIHGGGFMMGDAYQSTKNMSAYDGAALAGRHNVVLVTLNYRLGGLGFFGSDALRAEDREGSTGNVAMRDQRAGLEWVQESIASFGGDPRRVTIFGESAGGFSMSFHLVSHASWPLFHQVIIESGTSGASWFFQPYECHAKEFYAQWSEKIGCPRGGPGQLPCLRALDARKLLHPPGGISVASPLYDASLKMPSMPCGPVIDGTPVGLEGEPLKLMQQGRFNKVPLLVGANKDDGRLFQAMISKMLAGPPGASPPERLRYHLNWFFHHRDATRIEAAYPAWEFGSLFGVDWGAMLSRMIRDVVFQCSNRGLVEAWARYDVPAWLYTFSFDLGMLDKILEIGDSHGMEVAFVFRTFLKTQQELAPHMEEMADIIGCKWTTFAKTGRPVASPKDLPTNCGEVHAKYAPWPEYDRGLRRYYSLQFPPQIGHLRYNNVYPDDEFPSDVRCNVIDQIAFPWRGPQANATEPLVLV